MIWRSMAGYSIAAIVLTYAGGSCAMMAVHLGVCAYARRSNLLNAKKGLPRQAGGVEGSMGRCPAIKWRMMWD